MKNVSHMVTKLRQQGGVCKPRFNGECWAEKRIYTGSLFPAFVNCSKRARDGTLTCWWHRDREQSAQDLKANETSGVRS